MMCCNRATMGVVSRSGHDQHFFSVTISQATLAQETIAFFRECLRIEQGTANENGAESRWRPCTRLRGDDIGYSRERPGLWRRPDVRHELARLLCWR